MTDQIVDASEYGVGRRRHVGIRRIDGAVEAMFHVPAHLEGFAQAELRDRLSNIDFTMRVVA